MREDTDTNVGGGTTGEAVGLLVGTYVGVLLLGTAVGAGVATSTLSVLTLAKSDP